MILHSIRWRLQLWHGLMLLLVLTGFGFTAHQLQRANDLRRVDAELQWRLGPLLDSFGRRPPPGPGGPGGAPRESSFTRGDPEGGPRPGPAPVPRSAETGGPPRSMLPGAGPEGWFEGGTNGFYFVLWSPDGSVRNRSTNAPAAVTRPQRVRPGGPIQLARTTADMRELYEFTPPGGCYLVGRSIAPELANLRQASIWLSLLGGTVLALGLIGGWWLATRAIRPIHDISAVAETIAAGRLSDRIDTEETDSELGQLARVLNSTFARLESTFARQQQFTADAAHELRTPVAVILMQTQATLARERSPAEYRETLESCQRAAQRMRTLTESLLRLARLDTATDTLKREPVDLGPAVKSCVELVRPLAEERQATLDLQLTPAVCIGDPESLAQVVTNLLTNALLHNPTGGRVRITTSEENGFASVTVTDSGPGIPEADLPRIFERFHRADKSRTGGSGGAGLGLAICRAIVDAHQGELSVASAPGGGTTFTMRIPTRWKRSTNAVTASPAPAWRRNMT